MFIAIVGTPSSGKETVLGYLERKYGFKRVGLSKVRNGKEPISEQRAGSESCSTQKTFSNPSDLLDYATHNWLSHFVTTDLRTHAEIEVFIKRPFFLLVSVDGPLRVRFEREKARTPALGGQTITLEEFVDQHDSLLHASSFSSSTFPTALLQKQLSSDFRRVLALAHVHVDNSFTEISALNWYLDRLDLLDEERLRPGWDTYFMVSSPFWHIIPFPFPFRTNSCTTGLDSSLTCITPLKLYETPRRRSSRSFQTDPIDGV
nr:dCMP deaminase [Cryptococcus depauperatus CBS 7855]